MKKRFLYAMMGAIALTGVVNFSACQSSDEIDVNPTYDGNAVKTSFTISIGDVKNPTRMVNDAVQADNAFQGMTDIYLFPFKLSGGFEEDAEENNIEPINESYIHLADINKNDFSANLSAANGKIYNDVNLSVGVNHFLFYGVTQAPENGKLKASYLSMLDNNWYSPDWAPEPIVKGSSKVSDITFDLVPIAKGWTLEKITATEPAVKTIAPLNAVDVIIKDQITAASEAASVVAELTKLQKTLRNDVSTEGAPKYEFYAGSSTSMLSLMTMLYNTLKNNAAAYTSGGTNYAAAIITEIEKSFNAPAPSPATNPYVLTWKADPGFPANLHLPDGAVAVKYTGTNEDAPFEFVKPTIGGLEATAINNFTYPASLYYTVNTPAMTKDAEYLDNAENADKKWSAIATADNYPGTAVTAATRSVIMQNQVQYAVGRLDVYVRVKEATIINDNSKGGEQPVSVPDGGYTLTGVLIGGQKQVGWDFTPIDGASEMTIWDNTMASTITAKQGTAWSDPNYTLALETKANEAINIALEFTNTGNDFCGFNNNLIPAGSKFYLVAKLDPKDTNSHNSQVEQNPEDPWANTSTVINQVIKQDYITTVNLIIGENSLKSAYNVVPDLRSPKLEFGLSVDLHWRTGLKFEQTF